MNTTRGFRAFRTALSSLLAVSLWSCASAANKHFQPKEFDTQEEAGSGHIAVLSISPWDEALRNELQPTFTLTPEGALTEIVPTAMILESKLLDTLKVVASVSAPSTSSTSSTSTSTTRETGKRAATTYSSEETTKKEPGSAPDVDLELPTDRKVTDLPSKKEILEGKVSLDPIQRYALATALYQEIRLLDRYVTDAAIRKGYRPYVIRLQASLMPSARNEPYDAYMSVSFFPSSGTDFVLPPYNPQLIVAARAQDADLSGSSKGLQTELAKQLGVLSTCLTKVPADRDLLAAYRERLLERVAELRAALGADSRELPSFREPLVRTGLLDLLNVVSDPSFNEFAAKFCNGAITVDSFRQLLQDLMRELGYSRAPVVVPLLVTDSLEAASSSRSTDVVRQYALALSALVSGFSLSANAQKYSDELLATVGNDYNSLYSVSRLTDNTLRVRFGALLQNAAHYAMVPQTHNISLLILVPNELPAQTDIALMARTEFVDANTGQPLPQRTPAVLKAHITKVFEDSLALKCARTVEDKTALLRLVSSNDLSRFSASLPTCRPDEIPQAWLTLTSLYVGSLFSAAAVTIPETPKPTWSQRSSCVTAVDDGVQALVARLEGEDLRAADIDARLVFDAPGGRPVVEIAPTKIEVRERRRVDVTFPSLVRLRAGKMILADAVEASTSPCALRLKARAAKVEGDYCVAVVTVSEKPQPKDPGIKLTVLPALLPTDGKTHFDLEISLKQKAAAPSEIVVGFTFAKDGKDSSGRLQQGVSRVTKGDKVAIKDERPHELKIIIPKGVDSVSLDIAVEQLLTSTMTIEAKLVGAPVPAKSDVSILSPPEKAKAAGG